MADLLPKERLQPSLLDRLTDEEPENSQEPRSKRVLSIKRLKECVHRDLVWLLNSSNSDMLLDFSKAGLAEKSVINFGMNEMAGVTTSTIDTHELEKRLKETIRSFEPRIISKSVRVSVKRQTDKMAGNTLTIKIEGDLWALPMPLHLFVRTELDLESGDMNITDFVAEN